ncbi:hypothetical protein GCM10023081_13840 [Arthrobacter ginkgonis]|uniref:DUF35 domain-containing protein n=1 Tax=Arthrobacter ginkgonis TaxID=1630594 RepID=A0ABP7C657_9MICC
MSARLRTPPLTDPDSAAFWEGCAAGVLLGQRCGDCGAWRWPPREHCPRCHAAAPVWERLAGTGRIAGLAVVHRPLDPTIADELPLAVAHIELDGTEAAIVLTSTLGTGDAGRARVGDAVAVGFLPLPDGAALPTFTLIDNPEE